MRDKAYLDGRKVVLTDDITEWARKYETCERRIMYTTTPNGNISTVFLGLDHSFGDGPPLWFETMVFGGEHSDYQERYTTIDEAEIGHARIVDMVDPEYKNRGE